MVAINGTSPYKIAAAADGWIRAIEDDNSVQCDCGVTNCRNNYVWIEHPNGEWSKYTHMVKNSVTNLGHKVGDWVTAGTYLGNEGSVGCASGIHLHFEVAQTIDTNTLVFSEYGGYIDGDWAKNVIPVICSISGNVFVENTQYVAGSCGTCFDALVINNATFDAGEYDVITASNSVAASGAVTFNQYSSGLYQGGDYVRLAVGFTAKSGTEFTARVRACNDSRPENNAVAQQRMKIVNPAARKFKVYPNPATNQVTVEWLQNQATLSHLFVADITGRVLIEILPPQKMKSGQMQLQFSAKELTNGTYFVHLISGDESHVSKLLVQH
jgi:hypothetical protein